MTQPTVLASTSHTPPPSLPVSFSHQEMTSVLLGPSAAMAQLWTQLRRLAPHIRCALLTGEPDCGQEAVARLLLDLSPQRGRPFLSLSSTEAEARLLRSGALSSIPQDALLFLPDIDRFSSAAQAALLQLMRLRRSRAFTIVASAREELRSLVSLGRFSPELADALGTVRLALPALRDRKEDLPMLLTHLLAASSLRSGRLAPRLSDDLLRAAMHHGWPGNLRELCHLTAELAAGAYGEELRANDLTSALSAISPHRQPVPAELVPVRLVSLETVMQEHTVAVLRACRGNKLKAAEVLGISRSTLYRMLDAATSPGAASLPLAS